MKPEKSHIQRLKLSGALFASLAAACLLMPGGRAEAQSIGNVFPNGSYLFQYTNTFSFTASTPATSITNITVQLTHTSLDGTSPLLRLYNIGNGLTISGSANDETVTFPLTSNFLYTANIVIVDSNGDSATNIVSFDTINPSYTFEAEDWNYSSGQFITNYPQTNGYYGLPSTSGVDYSHTSGGNGLYRPLGCATEVTGDTPRLPYINTIYTNYDIGFNNGGDFANYTRDFPAGTYQIYLRGADGGGAGGDSAQMGGAATGEFVVPPTGNWQNWVWVPLETNGAPVQSTFDGTAQTITVSTVGGSYNADFYLLLPPSPAATPGTVAFSNFYPNGTNQYQAASTFVFNATSPTAINSNNIIVTANATSLYGVTTSKTLFLANGGLSVTGPATDLQATIPLTSNMTYSIFIEAFDSSGNVSSTNVLFDTITPAYTWEAEDWDFFPYGNGYFASPTVDEYLGAPDVEGVDEYYDAGNDAPNLAYRGSAATGSFGGGLDTENANDVPRLQFLSAPPPNDDYDVGNTVGGQWGNYTRDYPAGVYNIFVRYASGGGAVTDAGHFSLVTGGLGTSSQTTVELGTYSTAATGGWQTYRFAPVLNSGGYPVRFYGSNGVPQTLRVTLDGAGHNLNYFLLMPADLSQNPPPYVSNFEPDGSTLFQYTNELSFTVNSGAGIPQSGVVLNLDGTVVSGLSFSGSSNTWNVTYPVTPNSVHTAIITLTDIIGTTYSTNVFATFNATNFQWEAADWDYNNGQFYNSDTVGVDLYGSTYGVPGTDLLESDHGAQPFDYRPTNSTSQFAFATTPAGDLPRPQFASATDYNIGFFGGGSWANYTRNYPTGTFNVWGRFAEGASTTEANLSQVTAGVGGPSQTTNILGTFYIAAQGWGTWEWAPLVDANSNLVSVTLTGTQNTLRLSGSPVGGQPEVNVNFMMLTPSAAPGLDITATLGGGNINIAFPTANGVNYQVVYKTNLTDSTWLPLGGVVTGNNSTQSVSDPASGTHRFYRVITE